VIVFGQISPVAESHPGSAGLAGMGGRGAGSGPRFTS